MTNHSCQSAQKLALIASIVDEAELSIDEA
jgi:hypothetical protein